MGRKTKSVNLLSGCEEGFSWSVVSRTYLTGGIKLRGTIRVQDNKQLYQKFKDEVKKRKKQWVKDNPERAKKYQQEWRDNNREEYRRIQREWRKNNLGMEKAKQARYRKNSKDKYNANQLKYKKAHPEKIRVKRRRHANKRKKGLGFVPLNESFENACAHHIDKKQVIHIPKEMHEKVSHNLATGKGMDKINALAFRWLFGSSDK